MIDIWTNRIWTPMLLKEIPKPFDSDDYIYELKFDGIRAVIFVSPKNFSIMSRNNVDLTNLFPELASIKKLVTKKCIFDGEIISTDNGYPSFSKIQNRMHLKNEEKIKTESINNPVNFIVFDILYEKDDLTNKTLLERKEILNKYKNTDVFIKTKYIKKDGIKLFKSVKKLGLEGIVAKNINSTYHIDKRTDDFIKIKNIKRDEFLIGGYIEKENSHIISLLLGEFVNKKLIYVGKVTMGKKQKLYTKLKKMNKVKNRFTNCDVDAIFIEPTNKCHVEYLEKTKSGHLRHPKFKNF